MLLCLAISKLKKKSRCGKGKEAPASLPQYPSLIAVVCNQALVLVLHWSLFVLMLGEHRTPAPSFTCSFPTVLVTSICSG